MQPVVTVPEMRAADEAARRSVPESELIRRAGHAVAVAALELVGGAYGRRVVVVAGKGNNGNDGRVAAGVLARRGAVVRVLDAAAAPARLPPCDLVIDAAYGTGFAGRYDAPVPEPGTPVVAVDIPSGVNADTGEAPGRVLRATTTVTFAALKPGLLMGAGRELSGSVRVADIGVAVERPSVGLLEDADAAAIPRRPHESHKWATAVAVVAGSPGMEGAAFLCARAAGRAGAGMVRLAVPGAGERSGPWPIEAVRLAVGERGWADAVLEVLARCHALVVGPGLGRDTETQEEVRRLVARSPVPVVVDADGLFALGDVASARPVVAGQGMARAVVLTPHDGEYRRLWGQPPGDDRIAAARRLAEGTGAVGLLKGSLTAVAAPEAAGGLPATLLSGSGSPVLATAGTGDVLSGVIGALLARGMPAARAAALGAHVHGAASSLGWREGLVSADLPDLVARWLSERTDG